MSTADLFTADFPHGSPAGYDRGCTGSACPNQGDPIFHTCREAKSLKRTDYARRHHPDGEPMKRNEEPATPVITDTEHGTPQGYRKGCRRDDCPGLARAGRTCVQAHEALQHTLDDTRAKRAAAGLAKPAPPAPPAPVDETDPKVARPGFNDRQIRAWAHANGIDPGARGPLKTTARAAYEAALAQRRGKQLITDLIESGDLEPAKPKPAPPSKPLTVEPLNEQAHTDTDRAEKLTIADLQRDLSRPDDALDALNAQIEQLIIERDAAESRATNLATALAAEEEAHALTRKRNDDELAEVRRRHEADARDLEEARSSLRAEARRANELQEQLDELTRKDAAPARINASYVPEVVPAVATTVMTVGDVRLELPAGAAAHLQVDHHGVHVQIGR